MTSPLRPALVLMARDPEGGPVKTRLTPTLTPSQAAAVAMVMLRCTAARLSALPGELVVAACPDGVAHRLSLRLGLTGVRGVDQGPGDLGERLDRVWRLSDPDRPIAFFGGDSPDVPEQALASIGPALEEADVALGPTSDGGYWTLAARRRHPALLREIDWDSGDVYDQTCRRAGDAGLVVARLAPWHDVDRPDDLQALRHRLQPHRRRPGRVSSPLARMAAELEQLDLPALPRHEPLT